jgi:hypothetical protein
MKGWNGAGVITTCGGYGPLLGGVGNLGDKSYLRKTLTGLCQHNMINIDFTLVAMDGWEGETISLFVDDIEVSSSILAVSVDLLKWIISSSISLTTKSAISVICLCLCVFRPSMCDTEQSSGMVSLSNHLPPIHVCK